MNGVLGYESALVRLYWAGPGTTWGNGMNFVVNHAPGSGLIARPIDGQYSTLPL